MEKEIHLLQFITINSMEKVNFRTHILSEHLQNHRHATTATISASPCFSYVPPEVSERPFSFDVTSMRKLMDGHNFGDRDWLFNLMVQSELFNPRLRGGKIFVMPDYNHSMQQQRKITMKRIEYLLDHGVFKGWLTGKGPESEMKKFALLEVIEIFDYALAVNIGVHFLTWGGAIQFFGTKRHHDKWLSATENYLINGCFAMTELGHGSNVRGIETTATYEANTGEFVINTPCESAQKYWIGGAANHATHAVVFSQLNIDGKNQGIHAFIAQIRDENGNICPNIRIADCGHKIGLNGVDNGRIWFDNLRIPRENLLNSVADVSPDGKYLSAIKDPDQRFAAFMATLASGRVTVTVSAVYSAKVSLAIAIRYALTRRAFSITANGPELLLLDYPSHQRRLLPLLAKTYAMSFAGNYLKLLYIKRSAQLIKTIHVVSSAFKATLTWHNLRILQECREACGGQGMKTENRIGQLKGEYDVQSTFEGDNNVLMQQVSKALLAEYMAAKKRNKPFKELGLEHMNKSCPVIPTQLISSTLRSTQFQNDIFCLRERDLLNRFAAEVSQYQAQGESKESAFVLSYQVAEDLGKAFSDRAILQCAIEAENNVTDASLKSILGLLRSMYVLVIIEEDSAFLRYGYLSTDNAAAVRKEVVKLCGEIRPQALALVSSFGIPDAFLSPIAFDWVAANSWSTIEN
ncbi:acyl-coenzyme A oxidase 3, peroxisomal [Olea europaea var. sylvestris]|uniref:acyl-coenzyme A oxidase 3, peroxisomal n=1 Tax=Olea europaea var. sylvestris TaxID=158386 RepID=UPI000C1CDE0D|nr:acyl-coenzyme A oxidase 3, peroxisomal [Olea europaea var. sylvestris]